MNDTFKGFTEVINGVACDTAKDSSIALDIH